MNFSIRRAFSLCAALLLSTSTLSGCQPKEVQAPAELMDEADSTLKTKHRADEVLPLIGTDGTYKALVFKLPKASDADSDYRVVFYRKQGNTFLRHGAEANLVNFQRPHLSDGPNPRVETSINRLGVRYHFVVDAKGANMVPSEGADDAGALVGHPSAK